jgi:hypothetical protein
MMTAFGYQVLVGIGFGFGFQVPIIIAQATVDEIDLAAALQVFFVSHPLPAGM